MKIKTGIALKKNSAQADAKIIATLHDLWFAWLRNNGDVKCIKDLRFVRTEEGLACRIECAKRWGFKR